MSQSSYRSLSFTIIKDAEFNCCVDEITYLLNNHDAPPEALLITGDPGNGKTLVGEYVATKYNPAEEPEISRKVIIVIKQIESISMSSFFEALLEALGDPSPAQGKLAEKKSRIKKLSESLGLRVVILDEFHDMLPRAIHERAASIKFTKWLMVWLGVHVVMMGLPECKNIIAYSAQIETRLRRVIELRSFSLKDDIETKRFASFMLALFKVSPKAVENFFDSRGEMLKRFILATKGNKRIIKRLLISSIERSEPSSQITIKKLHDAWLIEASKTDPYSKGVKPFKDSIEKIDRALLDAGLM
jgi:hypothetical protein